MPEDWLTSAPGPDFIGNHEDFLYIQKQVMYDNSYIRIA
jgi:hypothetical protein